MNNSSSELRPSAALLEITRGGLWAFYQRRRLMSHCSGLSVASLLFVVLLLSAVLLDAWWPHPAARWLGSIGLLLIVGGSLVWLWFVPWLQPYEPRSEARRFEQLDPRLRERLLAAVELSEHQPGVNDSIPFREQLQSEVAHLIGTVDPRQLIPWSLIERRAKLATIGVAMLFLLCMLPGLHLPQRMARIFFPFGDWGRISRIAITIERPTPQTKLIPRDDIVAIRARVDGPQPETLLLETRVLEEHGNPNLVTSSVSMLLAQNTELIESRFPFVTAVSRFESLLPATSERIEYRVTGGGASTPWYRLDTLPRPRIVEFQWQITPPVNKEQTATPTAFSGSSAIVSTADHGNLQVLAGSHVELHLSVEQPTSVAELRWVTSNTTVVEAAALPLRLDPQTGKLLAEFTVTNSIDYQIHVQSLESGFSNEFSPTYRITAVDDQAPGVTWIAPEVSRLIASPEESLVLKNGIVDELPLATLTRELRINASQWQSAPLTADSAVGNSTEMRQSSQVDWELDLLEHRLKPGDQIELKVIATDYLGQTGESSILQVMISTTSLAQGVSPGELLRRQVAAGLQRIEQKLLEQKLFEQKLIEQQLSESEPQLDDALDSPETGERSPDSVRQLEQTRQLEMELAQEISTTLGDVERALGESEEAYHSQLLIDVGQALTPLTVDHRRAQELHRHFETLTTHDVISRSARSLARLAEAESRLAAVHPVDAQTRTQLYRQQTALTDQLKVVQQTLVESVPLVHEDSRRNLRQSAAQLRQQISAAERFQTLGEQGSNAELAGSLAEQLGRLGTLSQLDSSLPAAMKIAQRRLSELAPPVQQAIYDLHQLLNQKIPLAAQAVQTTEQLSRLRAMERTAPQGDQLYATDLGNATRAIEALNSSSRLSREDLIEPVRDIAQALETLHAIHRVTQADTLLSELWAGELAGDKHTGDERAGNAAQAWSGDGARHWNAFELRLEQAAEGLRSAQLPDTISQAVEQLRHGASAGLAERKLSERLWNAQPPRSAVAELETVRAELQPIFGLLAPYAQAARNTLSEHAPHIAELAQQAAEEVRDVEQQSQLLAASIERNEVPDLDARLEQLANQTASLQVPIDRLRDALVDQADSQNLLDQGQTEVARHADAAIELVDRIDSRLLKSRAGTTPVGSPAAQSAHLQAAADDQAQSADALEQLAQNFQDLESAVPDVSVERLAERLAELKQQAADLANQDDGDNAAAESASDAVDPYAAARQLAELAAQDPQSVLEQLEQELASNPPMAKEMSAIARQTAGQALQQLDQATRQQQTLTQVMELSDPNFKAQQELLVHDLHMASEGTRQMLDTLNSQAKWTAGASKNETQEKQLMEMEQHLRAVVEAAQQADEIQDFQQLLATASELRTQLSTSQLELLQAGGDLAQASFEEFHQSGADLANRRREMRDRQRRVQQETVRDAQTIQRNEQQRLRQLENELKQVAAQVQRSAQQVLDARQQLEQQPEQAALVEQLAHRQRQLDLDRATQSAKQKLHVALARRAELAKQALEKINSQAQKPLDSVNPTAELASQLSKQAAEASSLWAEKLRTWERAELSQARATADELGRDGEQQHKIGNTVAGAADGLSRAARHERRLENDSTSQRLAQAAATAKQAAEHELHQAAAQLQTTRDQALANGTPTAQASAESTMAARVASQVAEEAIARTADSLRELLANQAADSSSSPTEAPSTSLPSPSAASASGSTPLDAPLDDAQKARLLDELDKRLHAELDLGPKEDDAEPAPSSGSPGDAPPTTLADAASQLAKGMSRARQPSPPSPVTPDSATADLATATESQMANAEPQPPVSVRVLAVDRRGDNWGELRTQTTDELIETQRDSIAPRFRKQVEAYFRELAERGGE